MNAETCAHLNWKSYEVYVSLRYTCRYLPLLPTGHLVAPGLTYIHLVSGQQLSVTFLTTFLQHFTITPKLQSSQCLLPWKTPGLFQGWCHIYCCICEFVTSSGVKTVLPSLLGSCLSKKCAPDRFESVVPLFRFPHKLCGFYDVIFSERIWECVP